MRIVPAGNGWRWLREGWSIFARSPVVWMLLVFSYWLVLSLIGAIPKIGPFVVLATLPAFAVSFMNIARLTAVGRQVTPMELVSGFRQNLRGIATLGVLYFFFFALAITLSALVDGGDLAQTLMVGRRTSDAPPNPLAGVVAALVYLPVLLAYWFAPALAAWENMSAPKALFYSFYAGWKNWRAMLVYGVVSSAIAFGGTFLLFELIALIAPSMLAAPTPGAAGPQGFLMFVLMPIILAGLSVLFASFFASYRDVFPEHPPP